MKILSRSDEIKNILNKFLTKELIEIILQQEKEILQKEAIEYHLCHTPIYCNTYPNVHFFSLKKHRHVLYDKDLRLMNEIRIMNGSTKKARDFRAERIWGKYVSCLRF